MTEQTVIALRLNTEVEFERRFCEMYEKIPRMRRQEWVRNVLLAGLNALDAGTVVHSLPKPHRAVESAASSSSAHAARPTPQATLVAEESKTKALAPSAKSLVGFFDAS